MKERAADRLSTLRLINAAIKDKDIAARAHGNDEGASEDFARALQQDRLNDIVQRNRELVASEERIASVD